MELALTHGPIALLAPVNVDVHTAIRAGAQTLAWTTAAFCIVRGLPVLLEGWRYFESRLPRNANSLVAPASTRPASQVNRGAA